MRLPSDPGAAGEQQRAGDRPAEQVDQRDVEHDDADQLADRDQSAGVVEVDVLALLGLGTSPRAVATASSDRQDDQPAADDVGEDRRTDRVGEADVERRRVVDDVGADDGERGREPVLRLVDASCGAVAVGVCVVVLMPVPAP